MAKTRARGWWYPWIFVAFMAVVVSVNMLLMYFAIHTWSGLENERYFEKGVAYNEALEGARAQAALGWRAELDFTPEEGAVRRGRLSVSFHGADGQGLEGLKVKAMLIRPTHQGFDTSAELEDQGGGSYAATVVLPLPGRWFVRVHAWRADGSFQMKQEIMSP